MTVRNEQLNWRFNDDGDLIVVAVDEPVEGHGVLGLEAARVWPSS